MVDYALPVAKRTRLRRSMAAEEEQFVQRRKWRKRNRPDSASDNVRGQVASGVGDGGKLVDASPSVNRAMQDGKVESEDESLEEIDAVTFGREGGDSVSSSRLKNVEGFSSKGIEENVVVLDEEEGLDSVNSNCSISKSAAVVKDEGLVCHDLENEDGSCGLMSSGKGKGDLEISPNKSIEESYCLNSNGCETGDCSYSTEPACCSDDAVDEPTESKASSSEDEYENSSDGNYEAEESESMCTKSESFSSESGKKKNRTYCVEAGSRREKSKKVEIIEGGLKRKRAYGLEILVGIDKDAHNSDHENENVKIGGVNCVARRTRSRYGFKVKRINSELGTASKPLCVDEDGSDFEDQKRELDSLSRHASRDSSDSSSGIGSDSYSDSDSVSDSDCNSDDEVYKPRAWSCGSTEKTQFNNESFYDILSEKQDDDTNKVESFHGSKLWRSKSLPSTNKCLKTEDCEIFPKVHPKGSEDSPKVHSKGSEDSPKVHSKGSEDSPKVHSKGSEDSPKVHSKGSEDSPKVHPKSCEDFLNVHPKRCKDSHRVRPTNSHKSRELKKRDVFNILVDSIIEDKDLPSDELDPHTNQASHFPEMPLPLKYNFEFEEPPLHEMSEEDNELDKLWAELDFTLRSDEIGVVDSSAFENEDPFPSKLEQVDLCLRGDHQLILDEQIGLKCRCCSYVKLEIKDIVPSFDTNPSGKSKRKESGSFEPFKFDDLQQDSDCDPHDGSDSQSHLGRTVWDIIPGIRDGMYPHQLEGFEFIWKHIAGGISLDELRESNNLGNGNGCIVSHAPGTGKTRLTIVFLQTYMELYPTCRPMIIAPSSMLLTWEEEFLKWKVGVPFHNLGKRDFTLMENRSALNFLVKASPSRNSMDNDSIRLVKLISWKKEKSILGISYRLFERLAGVRKNSKYDAVRSVLLELPGLVVFDEGHIPRNDDSLIWMALSKIKTDRRIILSGTPFQNNFNELSNTVRLARPNFAVVNDCGGYECRDKKRGRPRNMTRGKWDHLISSVDRTPGNLLETPELREIRALINPFVHIHKGSILQEKLPGLRKSVVILQPSELQKRYLESIVAKNSLEVEFAESLISVHPSLKLKCDKADLTVDREMLEKVRLNPDLGVKIQLLLEIIRLSKALNEKVLVFSQYIEPLNFIEEHLKFHFDWIDGIELFHMDGKRDMKKRQALINTFNDPTSEVIVLLASTKACSEGINLTGASRVVLLDVVWNPSVERQAICRAYRLGQKKVVHVYHLITSGTGEEDKYCRQMKKDRLSELVFSSEPSSSQVKVSSSDLNDRILEAVLQHEKLKNIFQKIVYQSKESNMNETFGFADQE